MSNFESFDGCGVFFEVWRRGTDCVLSVCREFCELVAPWCVSGFVCGFFPGVIAFCGSCAVVYCVKHVFDATFNCCHGCGWGCDSSNDVFLFCVFFHAGVLDVGVGVDFVFIGFAVCEDHGCVMRELFDAVGGVTALVVGSSFNKEVRGFAVGKKEQVDVGTWFFPDGFKAFFGPE